MDDEGFVLVFAKDSTEECIAGLTLIIEHPTLAQTRIHQQTQSEREVSFTGKITNVLRVAVFFQYEIVFGEVAFDFAMFVAHGYRHIHHFYFD